MIFPGYLYFTYFIMAFHSSSPSRPDLDRGHGKLKNEEDSAGDSGFGGSFPLYPEEQLERELREEELERSLKDLSIGECQPGSYEEITSNTKLVDSVNIEYIARGECQKPFSLSTNDTPLAVTSPSINDLLVPFFSQDEDGDTYAHVAICQGKEELLCKILNLVSPFPKILDLKNKLGQTLLQLATYVNLTSIIRILIDIGADVELPDNKGQTIIHIAAEQDNYDALITIYTMSPYFSQELCNSLQRLVEAKNYKGFTPLHCAVKHKSRTVAQLLVQIGADINAQDSRNGYTALHHAVLTGDITLVEFLITTCNPDLNAISYTGVTPLILARGHMKEHIAAFLVAAGADTNKETWEGDSWDSLSPS